LSVHLVGTSLEELRRISPSAVLFAFPYCVKKIDCPATRYSERCIASCRLCAVSPLLRTLAKYGISHYIILNDDDFLDFLAKNKGRIQALLGCGCSLSMKKFLQHTSEIGYKGVAFMIGGDTCSEKEYKVSYTHGGANQTYLDLRSITETLECLYSVKP
jgi:hypothetical protein